MTMNLSAEDTERLREAVRSGKYQNEGEALSAAIRLLGEPSGQSSLPKKAQREEFLKWTERRPGPGNPHVDDSRESIYEGRGE